MYMLPSSFRLSDSVGHSTVAKEEASIERGRLTNMENPMEDCLSQRCMYLVGPNRLPATVTSAYERNGMFGKK